MLLTIFNLPAKTRYVDVKSLIHSKCGFKDVILDNLTLENNNSKKVTVGLAEEEDAAILVRKINGLLLDGQQLYVETIKKKAASTVMNLGGNQQPMLQQPYYQQSNQPNYEVGYTEMQESRAQGMVMPSLGYGGMYGTAAQSSSANYGYPQQMQYQSSHQQMMSQSMVGYDQGSPLGFSNQGNNPSVWSDQNDWNLAGNASGGNLVSQQDRSSSRWENTEDSSSHPRRDAPGRDSGRDRLSRFGQDASLRDAERSAPRRDFGRDAPTRDRGRDPPREQGRDRDQGRNRDQGRDRDHGRDRDLGRDRNQGRDRDQCRDHGRDATARDRGREPPARNASFRDLPVRNAPFREPPVREPPVRNAPFREPPVRIAPFHEPPVRNAPPREHSRDALNNRRLEPSRAPVKRQIIQPPAIYGEHVTNSSPHMRTSSQQRDDPRPNQPFGKPLPKQKNQSPKAESNYIPPSKRPKKIAGSVQQVDKPQPNVPANNNQTKPNSKKKKMPDTPERKLIRTATWRHQIASIVSKEIIQNPKHKNDIPPEQFLPELKRAIRCRLEGLFGDDFDIRMPEMLKIYREKFNPSSDTDFFNQVREDIKANGPYRADAGEKAIPVKKKTAPAPKVENAQPAQSGDTTLTIPSYPQGDKRASKGSKKTNAKIFQDEEMLLSKMEPSVQKALIQEIDEMCSAVACEFEGESEPQFAKLDEHVKTSVIPDYKKMMKINIARRMLNVTPIMLRIFNVPKTVSRNKLAPALAKYGVTSLRKSERKKPAIYYGTCDTYDDHDRLCTMEPIVVDGSTVVIKPFHLTGKAEKKPLRINRENYQLAKDKDPMMEELEELDHEIDEDIINLNTDYDQSNSQEHKDGKGENENPETIEPDQDFQETEMVDDEDTNGNIKLKPDEERENIDSKNAENAQISQIAVKMEIMTDNLEQSVSIVVKENAEVDDTKNINNIPILSKINVSEPVENFDFTADVDIYTENKNKEEDSFKIDEENINAEKDLTELNAEDLEDFKVNIIDDIDMADLNDDDLVDW